MKRRISLIAVILLFAISGISFSQETEMMPDSTNSDTVSISKPLAENYLRSLSAKAKSTRQTSGIFDLIVAMTFAGFGIDEANKERKNDEAMVLSVGVATLGAISCFANFTNQSEEETEFIKIDSISDPITRDESAAASLQILAKMRKKQRQKAALFNACMGTVYLAFQPVESNTDEYANYIYGGIHFLLSGLILAIPSNSERVLSQYKRDLYSYNPVQVGFRTNYKDKVQLVLVKNF